MRWLGDEALRRYLKLKPPSYVPNRQEVVLDIRKTVGGAICDPEDIIEDVLDDNDFISIGKSSKISYFIINYFVMAVHLKKKSIVILLIIFRIAASCSLIINFCFGRLQSATFQHLTNSASQYLFLHITSVASISYF